MSETEDQKVTESSDAVKTNETRVFKSMMGDISSKYTSFKLVDKRVIEV